MGWRNTFILINRNANFHFVAVDLEGEVNEFLFSWKEVVSDCRQQSPKRVGETSTFKFQNFASLFIFMLPRIIVVKEVGSSFLHGK